MADSANSSSHIHTVGGPRRLGLMAISRMVAIWQNTLHYQFRQNFTREEIREAPGSLILLWHNRLFMGIGALRHSDIGDRKLFALVSASRDGAQLSEFLMGQGIEPIRGSSSRRGAVATRELLRVLARGDNVAITLDGPRGPCYKAQAGAALLVQLTRAPMYFVGAEAERCRTLNTWDKFIVPYPFSRVKIKLDRYLHPSIAGGKDERSAIQDIIQERLDRITLDTHRPDQALNLSLD